LIPFPAPDFFPVFMAKLPFRPRMMNYYNYFTEIEEHFVKRRGKHLLISPMDWGLIAAWQDAGVPLHVALRGIDIAMDGFFARQRRGSSKVNSLCYCHDAVMAEYADHLESHVGESSAGMQTASADAEAASDGKEEPEAKEIVAFLSERISEIKALAAKQYSESVSEGFHRIIARLEEVLQNLKAGSQNESEMLERDLRLVDDLLVTELKALVSPEETLEWEKEAKKELKVYRKRLPKEMYDKIRGNFMRNKVHRKFNLGELTLFRL
jgi:hypothetical protein